MLALKTQYEQARTSLNSLVQRIMMMGGLVVDAGAAAGYRARRDRNAESLKNAIENIQQAGCIIKDLDIGLVDFPTLFRGEEVYLCWKLGESGIHFWHGTQEGFAGRKPIDQDFLDHHQGDPPN